MRLWSLLILFVCLSAALYLGFGSPDYGERTHEILYQLKEM